MPLPPADELEIHRLLASYAHTTSEADLEGWLSLFTEDGVWERAVPAKGSKYNEAVIHEGQSGLRELLEAELGPGTQYVAINAVVDGEGDSASGKASIIVLGANDDGSVSVVATGTFDDEYRKTEDGWKFSRRSIKLLG